MSKNSLEYQVENIIKLRKFLGKYLENLKNHSNT